MLKNLLSGLTSPTKATVVENHRQSPQKPVVFKIEEEVMKKEEADNAEVIAGNAEETKEE